MRWILKIKHLIRKFRNLEYECATCGEKFRYKEFMLGANQNFKCKMCFAKALCAPLRRTLFSRSDLDQCFKVEPLEEDAP
jgi:DNA-directed RNA polymerase subunit RPC12/RpoP